MLLQLIKKDILIKDLTSITKDNINTVQSFAKRSDEQLNYKENKDKWSILECIEHLNRYGDFYLPEVKQALENSKCKPSNHFKPGLLGNYFAKSMLPKDQLNKMKTSKSMDPIHSILSSATLDKFLSQQDEILNLLAIAQLSNLTKLKTATSISRLIRLRLGDTLRVVVYHNLRHVVQAGKDFNISSNNITS